MTRNLRIGYLIQQFVPEIGAGPARAAEMARRWQSLGARVTIVTAMPNRPAGRIYPEYRGRLVSSEEWEGIRVLRSWLYARPDGGGVTTILNNATFLGSAAVNLESRDERFDVLIASSPPFFPHLGGVLHRALNGTPLVLEVRDLWPDYAIEMGVVRSPLARRALLGLERWMVRGADHVVAVTESFRARLIGKGARPERVSVIPNGVDLQLYRRVDEPPPIPELAPGSWIRLGYLGNIGRGQDLTTLIDAAKVLRGWGAPFRLVMAGDGPDRERIAAAVREAGLSEVTLHPPVTKAQTRAFYNSCDICLVPLAPVPVFQETIPSKLFEIMACERPVAASLEGEGRMLLESSGAGVATPPGDAYSLACAIRALAERPLAARLGMGHNGREWVRKHYDRDSLSDRYLDILDRVARNR